MRKTVYLILFMLLPFIGDSQTLFRSGRFLHHSTGGFIWGPNGSSTSIQQEIANYNAAHGYTGSNAVTMAEQGWPSTPWENEWERWHRIFENQDPNANIQPILAANKIVVVKSCFPSSAMTGMGQASDTLNYTIKSMYNYKWHWRHIVTAMSQRPENFFVIWTNAPLTAGSSNPSAAALSRKFTTWAKDTLAQGLDPIIGAFPLNIYVFHYFSKLTDEDGFKLLQYAVSNTDSHPNALATELVAPQFVNEIFDAAIAYEQGGPTLSVSPSVHNVTAAPGTVNFLVTSNTGWNAGSNQGWCTVTPAGYGNGIISAAYTQNTGQLRTATITVTVSGLPPLYLTLSQAGNSTKVLNINALLEGLYHSNGVMKQASDENGPRYSPGIADVITLELHNADNYSIVEYTDVDLELSTAGSVSANIPSWLNGSYYITLRHRNSIETTSAIPVSFANQVINYSFSQPSAVYGNNLRQMPDGLFVIFSSDVDQNGVVDTGDATPVENLSNLFASGYHPEDVNGDGYVDTADQTFLDNNQSGYVGAAHP